jgi:hypothetical protein
MDRESSPVLVREAASQLVTASPIPMRTLFRMSGLLDFSLTEPKKHHHVLGDFGLIGR